MTEGHIQNGRRFNLVVKFKIIRVSPKTLLANMQGRIQGGVLGVKTPTLLGIFSIC